MPEILACAREELAPGEGKLIEFGEFGIGVFNVGGVHHAVLNYCPHNGAPVCLGLVTGTAVANLREDADRFDVSWTRDGEILECPWHAWRFDIATGRCLTTRKGRIRKFPIVEKDGGIYVVVASSTELAESGEDGYHR